MAGRLRVSIYESRTEMGAGAAAEAAEKIRELLRSRNDPHTADFNDPHLVKVVTLDQASRQQQVHDGCFAELSAVPLSAITLTAPALLQATSIYCVVPAKNKAWAVYQTVYSTISERFPSSVLKEHGDARLYLDRDSAENIGERGMR